MEDDYGFILWKNINDNRGTGSFGNAILKHFLNTDIGEIRIFSRDEKKQDDMRHDYQLKYPEVADKIKFYIGDVRSLQSCKDEDVEYVIEKFAEIVNYYMNER